MDLSGNRIYRNSTGVQPSAGQSSNNCELSVVSIGNLFAGNGQGYAAFGGAGLNVFDPANLNGSQGNHLRLHSVKDVFRDNTASGILVFAGLRRPGATGVFSAPMNDNEVRLDLLDASLEQGPANDIVLVAGFTQPATGPTPGTGNVIEALIRRSSVRADATPELLLANGNAGGATTNEVVLIGSDVAFQVTNDPFDLNTFGVNFCEFFNPPCN